MKSNTNKTKSLTFEMILHASCLLAIINILLIAFISYSVNYALELDEREYMTEIIENISRDIESELQRYIDAVQILAKNTVIIEYLETTTDIGLQNTNTTSEREMIQELKILSQVHKDAVYCVGIGSLESDGFIDYLDGALGANFSLSSRPYYNAITENRTTVSDAYTGYASGKYMVSIAHPIKNQQGTVLGLVCLDIYLDSLIENLSTTSFGASGTAFLVDNNFSLLAASAGISESDVASKVHSETFIRELENPTGEIIKFETDGDPRMGGITYIDNSNWILVASVSVDDFQDRTKSIVLFLGIVQFFSCFIMICLNGHYIYKKLSPIKLIQNYMHEISTGNLQSKLDYNSHDEMGALVEDIQHTSSVFFHYIHHISDTIHQFAQGNIQSSEEIDYIGDFKPIEHSIHNFIILMNQTLLDLKIAVDEVNTGAENLASGAMVLANGSQEQAASVKELSQLISKIDEDIQDTSLYSNKISTFAESLSQDIQENNNNMQTLAENVQSIKDHSNEVTRIIKAIEEVAFQTNILALNAAVEAARAGESGRGFAIVADEVRNLSLRTTQAVNETTKIITEMAIFVESSTDLAHLTSSDLEKISQKAEDFVKNMEHITKSSADQSHAISNIHLGIDDINSIIEQNSAISEESASLSEELSLQTIAMMEQINHFKLK